MSATPVDLLLRAFDVQRFQIVDAPSWTRSERYDIRATLPAGSKARVPEMIRALLEERFALKVRRDTRSTPVYELRVSPSGAKLVDVGAVNDLKKPYVGDPKMPVFWDRTSGLPGDEQREIADRDTYHVINTETSYSTRTSEGGVRNFDATRVRVAQLRGWLAGALDRPVLDRTGLTGLYQFKITLPPIALDPSLPIPRALALQSLPESPSSARFSGWAWSWSGPMHRLSTLSSCNSTNRRPTSVRTPGGSRVLTALAVACAVALVAPVLHGQAERPQRQSPVAAPVGLPRLMSAAKAIILGTVIDVAPFHDGPVAETDPSSDLKVATVAVLDVFKGAVDPKAPLRIKQLVERSPGLVVEDRYVWFLYAEPAPLGDVTLGTMYAGSFRVTERAGKLLVAETVFGNEGLWDEGVPLWDIYPREAAEARLRSLYSPALTAGRLQQLMRWGEEAGSHRPMPVELLNALVGVKPR